MMDCRKSLGLLVVIALCWPGAAWPQSPRVFRVGSFSLTPDEAVQVRQVLTDRWIPAWIGSATLEVRVIADPGLDRAITGSGTDELRFDLLETHPDPYEERWSGPGERPLAPFLEWSAQARRWPRWRREALLLARKGSLPPGGAFTLATVSPHSWLGGQVQLRMLAGEQKVPTRRLALGSSADALRALAVGWADLAAVPRDPAFSWGLPYNLSDRFVIYSTSPMQPAPIWVLSRAWSEEHPAGKAWLREVLREHFGPRDLVPPAQWGREP